MGIVVVNRLFDRQLQLLNALEDAVTSAILGDVPEPAFNHVQPGTARREKMDVEAFVSLRQFITLGCLWVA